MKRSHVNKIKETITDLQNNKTKWKNVILEKLEKRNTKFRVHMKDKNHLQFLIQD
jgi:hypothetical protein